MLQLFDLRHLGMRNRLAAFAGCCAQHILKADQEQLLLLIRAYYLAHRKTHRMQLAADLDLHLMI